MSKRDAKLESDFQSDLIKELKLLFPGCQILKNDSGYQQGIPDLLVLYNNCWAMLEVKPYALAPHEDNQDWFIDRFAQMSFGAFIYPENKKDVLNALQESFRTRGQARDTVSE